MSDTCNKKSFWCAFNSIVQPLSLLVIAGCAVAFTTFTVNRPVSPEGPQGPRGPRFVERGERGDRPAKAPAPPAVDGGGGSQKD